jgi:hypothetical protein
MRIIKGISEVVIEIGWYSFYTKILPASRLVVLRIYSEWQYKSYRTQIKSGSQSKAKLSRLYASVLPFNKFILRNARAKRFLPF